MRPSHEGKQDAAGGTVSDPAMQLVIDRLSSIEAQMREDRTNAAASRARMYEKQEATEKIIRELGSRVENVERSMLTMHPTVQEFVALKANAQVAGKLGAALWKTGQFIMAVAAGAAAMWAAFWTYFQWK